MISDRPVRVLHVFLDLSIGGAQTISMNTLRAVDPTRCHLIVACLGSPGTLAREMSEIAPVHCRNHLGTNDVGALISLSRLMYAERVDVVHTYLYSRSSVYGRLAAILARIPVIVASEMGRVDQYSWKRWTAETVLSPFTHHFITPSEATKTDLIQTNRLRSSKVTVIYPGIDSKQFDIEVSPQTIRRNLKLPEQGPVVGVVARLDPVKRHVNLIAAFPEILRVVPSTQLVLVGDGPEMPRLRRLAHETHVAEQLHFLGSRRDIPQVLRALDLMVLPSRSEGLPNSILEAMAAAVPVVATRVGGVPEIVIDGETGLLVPPDDPGALAIAVADLLKNPELRHQMGLRGQARVQTHFTDHKAAVELEMLYRRLLTSNGVPNHAV